MHDAPLLIDFIWLMPETKDSNKHLRPLIAAEAQQCFENVTFRFHGAAYPPPNNGITPPDAVVAFGSALPPHCDLHGLIDAVRRRYTCPITVWVTDDPYEFDHTVGIAPLVDHLFTNDRGTVPYYGLPNVSALPLAAAEADHVLAFLDPLPDSEKEWDFIFCGVAFENRIQVIEGIHKTLSRARTLIIGPQHGNFGWPSHRLPGITFGDPQPYRQVLELYRKSKVVLNLSRTNSICNSNYQIVPSTPAPRTYEVAAMGIPQIAFFDRPELLEDFEPDQIAVFNTRNEFDDIASRLINDGNDREVMGRKSRAHTLKNHLYRHRLNTIIRTLFPIPDGSIAK
jgi:spore maturation protein CgeB